MTEGESKSSNSDTISFLREIRLPGETLGDDLKIVGRGAEKLFVIVREKWRQAMDDFAHLMGM